MAVLACLLMILPAGAPAEDEQDILVEEIVENVLLNDEDVEIQEESGGASSAEVGNPARDDFIDRIVALGKKLYEDADGKRKRAHYASDIYVCKNFTVYLFRQNRDDFRMEAYPDVQLVIPNNLPAKQCRPYAYGFLHHVPCTDDAFRLLLAHHSHSLLKGSPFLCYQFHTLFSFVLGKISS